MKVLDVGCGQVKRGDVGVDIVQYPGVDVCMDVEKDPLPFPNGAFDVVFSSHFLEHISNPEQVLLEMLRVARVKVELVVPHRYSIHAKSPIHKVVFNKKWFLDFARKHGVKIACRYTVLPFLIMFVRPHELFVEIWK